MTTPAQPQRTRPWKPSARDQAIYRAVVIEGRTQLAAGQEFGRSQSAVSRLLGRFERWRGGAKPQDSGELDPLRQRHFDRWLARQRHDEVYTRAMRLSKTMEEAPAKTHREGARDGREWHEDVTRDQWAAAGQMLKTALRANEALERFADKEPLPPLPGGDTPVDIEELLGVLAKLRKEAEEAGRVPKSRTKMTADIWLRALLGERQEWYLAHLASESEAMFGLVESVLSSRIRLKEEAARRAAEAGGGCVVAATTQSVAGENALDPLCYAAAAKHSHPDANPPLEPAPPPRTHETHETHTRIFVGGHPPLVPSGEEEVLTPEPPKPWDPYRGGGRVVMIEPGAGKKFGEPHGDYADDPLGRLYRRIEERLQREAREARLRAAAGG